MTDPRIETIRAGLAHVPDDDGYAECAEALGSLEAENARLRAYAEQADEATKQVYLRLDKAERENARYRKALTAVRDLAADDDLIVRTVNNALKEER